MREKMDSQIIMISPGYELKNRICFSSKIAYKRLIIFFKDIFAKSDLIEILERKNNDEFSL